MNVDLFGTVRSHHQRYHRAEIDLHPLDAAHRGAADHVHHNRLDRVGNVRVVPGRLAGRSVTVVVVAATTTAVTATTTAMAATTITVAAVTATTAVAVTTTAVTATTAVAVTTITVAAVTAVAVTTTAVTATTAVAAVTATAATAVMTVTTTAVAVTTTAVAVTTAVAADGRHRHDLGHFEGAAIVVTVHVAHILVVLRLGRTGRLRRCGCGDFVVSAAGRGQQNRGQGGCCEPSTVGRHGVTHVWSSCPGGSPDANTNCACPRRCRRSGG